MIKSIVVSCVLLSTVVVLVQASEPLAGSDAAAGPLSGDEARNFRYEEDKKELTQFLNTKNMIKTIIKLIFGSTEESAATSRQVLNVVVKVLDMFRNSYSQRARSAEARGTKHVIDDAIVAGISMLRGTARSYTAGSDTCVKRFMCEASRDAVREGREMGYLLSQLGGYVSSQVVSMQKSVPFAAGYEAVRKGRSGEDCTKLYTCNETY